MKKLIIAIMISWACTASAQEKQKINVSFGGGVFAAGGMDASFVGLVGPKISTTFAGKKVGYEIGINGFPGIIIPYEGKTTPALVLGGTISIKTKKKVKPIVGVVGAFSQGKWYPMFGIGFSL